MKRKERRRVKRLLDERGHRTREIRVFTVGGGWGNSVQFQDRERGLVYGFVPWDLLGADLRRPLPGDLLTCAMQSGRTGVWRFTRTEWCSDPDDMFIGSVEEVGYADEPAGVEALEGAA